MPLYIINSAMDKKIDLQKQVYFLAVTNNLDATLFFEKRAKIYDFYYFFKKDYLFDKLEFINSKKFNNDKNQHSNNSTQYYKFKAQSFACFCDKLLEA